MTLDTIFYIVSCTKLVSTITALQSVEAGEISLDTLEDIARIAPELLKKKIISGEKGNFKFEGAKKKISQKMLLNHTSGFSNTVSRVFKILS